MSTTVSSQFPNMDTRLSFFEMNSLISASTSTKSRSFWWTWQTARELRRTWVIVLRSQVFNQRRALKLRSASAEEAGETRSKRTSFSTSLYSPRSSVPYFWGYPLHRWEISLTAFYEKAQSEPANQPNRSLRIPTGWDCPQHRRIPRSTAHSPRLGTWGDLRCHGNGPPAVELRCRQARDTMDGSNHWLLSQHVGPHHMCSVSVFTLTRNCQRFQIQLYNDLFSIYKQLIKCCVQTKIA